MEELEVASVSSKANTISKTSVFLLLTLQHVATALLVTIFNCSEGAHHFLQKHDWLVYASLAFYVTFFVAAQSDFLSDARPVCVLFLTMCIVAISIILSCDYVTSFGEKKSMLKAVWVLAGTTACLTALSKSKCYTDKNGQLFCFILQVICFGINMVYSTYPWYEFAIGLSIYTATSVSIQAEDLPGASNDNVFTILAINAFIAKMSIYGISMAIIGVGVAYLILLLISYAVYRHQVENNTSYKIMQAINSIFGQ